MSIRFRITMIENKSTNEWDKEDEETVLVALLEAGVPVQTEDEAHAEWLARQEAK